MGDGGESVEVGDSVGSSAEDSLLVLPGSLCPGMLSFGIALPWLGSS